MVLYFYWQAIKGSRMLYLIAITIIIDNSSLQLLALMDRMSLQYEDILNNLQLINSSVSSMVEVVFMITTNALAEVKLRVSLTLTAMTTIQVLLLAGEGYFRY